MGGRAREADEAFLQRFEKRDPEVFDRGFSRLEENPWRQIMKVAKYAGRKDRPLKLFDRMVPQTGLEPVTPSLRMTCSTN